MNALPLPAAPVLRPMRIADVDAVMAIEVRAYGFPWSRGNMIDSLAAGHVAEVMVDENMHARGSLQWIDHPELGRVVLPHSALVFEGTPRRPIEPSRPLGAGNDAVFGEWLGHSPQQLAAWRADGVIGP